MRHSTRTTIEEDVTDWLQANGVPDPWLTPLVGGGNNQTFRVDSEYGPFLLKRYFRHARDPRDRLATEFAFLRHLWDCGIRRTPQPLAQDDELALGLYSFIEGRAPTTADITQDAAEDALSFILAINTDRARAPQLDNASEACFSLAEHVACVDRRFVRLNAITHPDASNFVREQLSPAWQEIRAAIPARTAPLARCLSPSDFGFHNVIITENSELRYLDFEYAGWDDPAKLICDFFSQPQVPVPADTRPAFIAGLRLACNDNKLAERVQLLWPLYRIKWICIVLNSFLTLGRARRAFAGQDESEQLTKAQHMLTQIAWTP
jgi:hypothetical protein